ncbi:hypothetical protein HanLR1_Chr11g0389951 [Helianthus annuus]|nr:hypothetical protein HanHA89_Chr11g0412421 [Helianthus annuus]KAJ0684322.1 hypothetical protein HanLR1_Chr11g0389951 [Helianthus annuus]
MICHQLPNRSDEELLIKSLNATVDTNQQAQSFVEASLNQLLSSLAKDSLNKAMSAKGYEEKGG